MKCLFGVLWCERTFLLMKRLWNATPKDHKDINTVRFLFLLFHMLLRLYLHSCKSKQMCYSYLSANTSIVIISLCMRSFSSLLFNTFSCKNCSIKVYITLSSFIFIKCNRYSHDIILI